ncbi:MAG: NrsF family protein [Alphaproteobacteria bacterium]
MTTTPDLIESLAAEAGPVRRLRHPLLRAGSWLALAACVMLLLAIGYGVRGDIGDRWQEPVFAATLAASAATGILAAVAAFMISLPDRSRVWLLLPVPSLLAWLSTIGYGCLTDWVALTPNGIEPGEATRCFATLLLTSVPLSIALLLMLRYAAWLRPTETVIAGALAVAAITATALSLFHPFDATIMVLIWNVGVAALFVALGGAFGGRLLAWLAPRPLLHAAP